MALPIEHSYIVDNDRILAEIINDASVVTNDLRVPFRSIANDFRKSERKIFTLKSEGAYPDLSEEYKDRKEDEVDFIYPILLKSGRLAASLLVAGHPESEEFISKTEMTLGTSVPYAIFHQSDEPRSIIPQRKVVFIDGGPTEIANDSKVAGRSDRWFNIIVDHVLQVLTEEVFD